MPAGGSRHSPPPSQAKLAEPSSGILSFDGACAPAGTAKSEAESQTAADRQRRCAMEFPLEANVGMGRPSLVADRSLLRREPRPKTPTRRDPIRNRAAWPRASGTG